MTPGLLAEKASPAALHLGQRLCDKCAHRIMVTILGFQQPCLFPGSESGDLIALWRNRFQCPVAVALPGAAADTGHKGCGSWGVKSGFLCFGRGSSSEDSASFYCS